MFGNIVVIVFQSSFYLEMYQTIFLYFLKIIFDINILERYKNIKKLILNKNIQKFMKHGLHRNPK
jgi:hypothetical protein